MIVNHTDQGWRVINQLSHGLLAGQIAMQFRADLRPNYWCASRKMAIQVVSEAT